MMSTAGYIGSIVLALICLAIVSYPLFKRQVALGDTARQQREQDELVTSYERVVTAIRDLDEDFNTGKLHREDYDPERERWVARGVTLLHQLEAAGAVNRIQKPTKNGHSKVKAKINTESAELADDEIEAAVARYREQLQSK